jgi:Methyltransferase domain
VRRSDLFLSAKSSYAHVMRWIRDVLTRAGILSEEPPERDHRLAHWAYSLTRIHDSAGLVALDVPWWTYRAIDVVDVWLSVRAKPVRIFEYGSGASTVWLARRADEVHTVEHHAEFAAQFKPMLDEYDNIEFSLVEPITSSNPIAPSEKEGYDGVDFSAYVWRIDHVGGLFDLIVIDGRARVACLAAALPHLKADGLIVFDNTNRVRYRDGIAASPVRERRLRGLAPTLPYPDSTSLLTKR